MNNRFGFVAHVEAECIAAALRFALVFTLASFARGLCCKSQDTTEQCFFDQKMRTYYFRAVDTTDT